MVTETTEKQELKFDHWCIVELMGHQRIAGRVTEQNLFGTALMRVDVPAVDEREGFTKFYGASAIYAVTPVSEDVARAMVSSYDTRPVEEWRLQRLLTPPTPAASDESEQEYLADPNGYQEGAPFEYDAEYDEPHPTTEEIDEQDAQWNANRAADMFGADGVDDDGNEFVELQ